MNQEEADEDMALVHVRLCMFADIAMFYIVAKCYEALCYVKRCNSCDLSHFLVLWFTLIYTCTKYMIPPFVFIVFLVVE